VDTSHHPPKSKAPTLDHSANPEKAAARGGIPLFQEGKHITGTLPGAALAGLILTTALCGCTVPMQTIDASRAACSSYGFQPGSDAFAECVQKEQHLHTLLIYAGGGGAASQPQTLPPLSDPAPPMQAPALPPLPQPQTQFCFGSGAFEQCQ
jgi:hypothetical protein